MQTPLPRRRKAGRDASAVNPGQAPHEQSATARQKNWQPIDYKDVTKYAYDAILIADEAGAIQDCNSRAVDTFGFARNQLVTMAVSQLISGMDKARLNSLCQNLQSDKCLLVEASCCRVDNRVFPAEIAMSRLPSGRPLFCFFIRDITRRHKAEAQLRTEHHALQNARDGIVITDEKALIEYANPAFLAMWCYNVLEDLVGQDLRPLLAPLASDAPPEQQPLLWWALIVDHESWSEELLAVRKDGSTFHVLAQASCNRDSDGRVIGTVLSFTDLTDRNRAEEAVRQTERQRAMLASVGAACHHLGQPTTVLATNLEMIERRTADLDRPELREMLKQSRQAATQVSDILFKLNTVSEFRTIPYLEKKDRTSPENTILEI